MPRVLLLHGWGGSFASDWRANGWPETLEAAGRSVVAVDILGHGNAERPTRPDDYADLASDVSRQLPDGDLDAIGFSLGAKLLLELAARKPRAFGRLVLGGVGSNVFQPEAAAAAILDALDASGGTTGSPPRHLLADYAIANGNAPAAVAACLRRPPNPIFSIERMGLIKLPVLLVAGTDDFIAQPVAPLADALPFARVKLLDRVKHLDLLTDTRFKALALEFLAQNA